MRIRRLKKQDTKSSRSAQNDGHGTKGSNRKTKQDEKIAYLLFTADIKTENNGSVELCVKSEQIYLSKSQALLCYIEFHVALDFKIGTFIVAPEQSVNAIIMVAVCPYTDANHDPPEIHRIIPSYGTAQGGEQIVIVGTRMHTGK